MFLQLISGFLDNMGGKYLNTNCSKDYNTDYY